MKTIQQILDAMGVTTDQICTVAKHYITAALWADAPENTHPKVTMKARAKAYEDCAAFIAECGPLFTQAMQCEGYGAHPDAGSPEAAFGHDFWLTRQGHGVGFWCRDELKGDDNPELGDQLSSLCGWSNGNRTKFPEANIEFYRGWMYLS